MSEYPELDGYDGNTDLSSKDLAARERELLGDDVAAELVGTETVPSEANESDYAEFESSSAPTTTETAQISSETAKPGAGPQAYVPQKVDLSESEFLKDWKTKRELELERKDKASSDKQESIKEKARKAIDDFYENYNAKKEKEAEKVHADAEAFTKKRDAEIGNGKGTTWDRIAEIVDGMGRPAEGIAPADKKRFAEVLKSLKGDPNAPGAAGY